MPRVRRIPNPSPDDPFVSVAFDPLTTEQINTLLDGFRERHNITSDESLSRVLGVSDSAIYRWRRGKIDRSAAILAAVVISLSCCNNSLLRSTPT